MITIFQQGNYIIVEGIQRHKDDIIYTFPKGMSAYIEDTSGFILKTTFTQEVAIIPFTEIAAGNVVDNSGTVYTEASLRTFLQDCSGFNSAGGGSVSVSLNLDVNDLQLLDSGGAVLSSLPLDQFLDDTNLSRVESVDLAANGIATFTRNDTTTFTGDFSVLLDNVNTDSTVVTATSAFITTNGVGVDIGEQYIEFDSGDTWKTQFSTVEQATTEFTSTNQVKVSVDDFYLQNPDGTTFAAPSAAQVNEFVNNIEDYHLAIAHEGDGGTSLVIRRNNIPVTYNEINLSTDVGNGQINFAGGVNGNFNRRASVIEPLRNVGDFYEIIKPATPAFDSEFIAITTDPNFAPNVFNNELRLAFNENFYRLLDRDNNNVDQQGPENATYIVMRTFEGFRVLRNGVEVFCDTLGSIVDYTAGKVDVENGVLNNTNATGTVFNGTGAKVATFNGDIDVTGTIDPDGVAFTSLADTATAQAHFIAKGLDFDAIIWRNATNNSFYRGSLEIVDENAIAAIQAQIDSGVTNMTALQAAITANDADILALQTDKANTADLGAAALSNDFNDLDNIPDGVTPYFGCTQVTTEENAGLNNGQFEHAFGNGASSTAARTHGQLVPYRSRLDYAAISAATHGNALTQVEIYVQSPSDNLPQATGVVIDLPNNDKVASYFYADDVLEIEAGSLVTYRTILAGAASFVVMTSNWVHLDQNPNITTGTPPPVVNDVDGVISYTPFFGGSGASLEITNTSANPITSWCVTVLDSNWTLTSDFGQISHTDLGNGNQEICNVGFNGAIAPGASVTVQFQVTTGVAAVQTPTDNGVV